MQPYSSRIAIRHAALLSLPLTLAVSVSASAQVRLEPDDSRPGDQFGTSGQIDNGYAIVGARYTDDVDGYATNSRSGSAYIFAKDSDGNWAQEAKLLADDAQRLDYFGYASSLSGNSALIGAWGDDDNGAASGSAYVFTRDMSGHWAQETKLLASDGQMSDFFGRSVSLSGNTAAVGAYQRDDADPTADSQSGAVYMYTRESYGSWSETRLNASDAMYGDQFGRSLSLSGDTLAVAAPLRDVAGVGIDAGAAYVYTRSGSTWTEQATLTPSDGAAGDRFGWSTATDGDRIIVGAYRDDDGADGTTVSDTYNSGSAYIFERNGDTWAEVQKLVASDPEDELSFGSSVAISGDYALVGASFENTASQGIGRAYLFELGDDGLWNEVLKIEASGLDPALDPNDRLGWFVSVDGIDMLVGAYERSPLGTNSQEGAAYVVAIPEPATASLAALGGLVALCRRRSRT